MKNKLQDKLFFEGVVSALDIVATYNDGHLFKEIVKGCGMKNTLLEINNNGLFNTKRIANREFSTGDFEE